MPRLMLFAKRPRLGRVKTRLCPPLTAAQALQLYRAFLADRLDRMRAAAGAYRAEVWWDGPPDDLGLDTRGIGQHVQPGGDLGERLACAFARAEGPALAIGADSPTLGAEEIEAAFAALRAGCPLVVQPSTDGGYVLLGLARPIPGIFREIPWSTPQVCEATLRQARELGVEAATLPAGFDVDDEAGLQRLRVELDDPRRAAAAPHTRRVLELLFPRRTP